MSTTRPLQLKPVKLVQPALLSGPIDFTVREEALKKEYDDGNCAVSEFTKECNKFQLKKEFLEHEILAENQEENEYLYPNLNDPNFNVKISEKKEFNDTKYDGEIYDVKAQADLLSKAEFELSPHQAFVRNFLSFQTPYNSLLLYHGLGSGKTCSAIGVCEEQRDYLKQMGISKRTIIVASPNVQDNFRSQLFDERKLKLVDGLWNIRSCTGNKMIKEINPMNMKGLSREKVVSQIKSLINISYLFLGYIEFANYIAKIEQVKGEYKSEKEKQAKMARNLKYEFSSRLIVIDEVHNIRITEDNENKKVALYLTKLVRYSENVRLLLLSATPMYNSYKEIIWLLNLMNLNDRRATIDIKDIFDKNGNFKRNTIGEEVGKDLLIRKATGYISFVRGENPYTFPFRIYPNEFALDHTIGETTYPSFQMNGKRISESDQLKILHLYLTEIGSYQSLGYKFIIENLKQKKISITTNKGVIRDMPSFENMESFGYTLLQLPLEALNIIYPYENLDDIVGEMKLIESDAESEVDSDVESESESEHATPVIAVELEPELEEDVIESMIRGGAKKKEVPKSAVDLPGKQFFLDPHELTGKKGLHRMMNYVETISPPEKGKFEYKSSTISSYGKIFSTNEIGKYSSKIKNICDSIVSESGKISDGILLIYSQYIDGGLIPIALALEEMGFTRYGDGAKSLFKTSPVEPVDVRTMAPRKNKKDAFMPARYTMITGDPRISPNNDYEMKALTNDDNKDGHKVKVVLISKAGSEGLDFKFIRQVHVLEPWYNMNRIEQIIGRAVRNFSHKDLPFEKRNVEIFLYGTILEDNEEEAADLYVYRVAEVKAVQIGKVSRLLKETAVDCIINHDQTNFTQENFKRMLQEKITQELSTGQVLSDFKVGDVPFSAACDYMADCQYTCSPDKQDEEVNEYTYNETFIMMNSEKILQKVRMLMKERFFYTKKDLIDRINAVKPFPRVQIYAALTQLVEDSNEYIVDRYGRTGYLVNIGEYYLFQPSELDYDNVSIFDRSVPIDYKNDSIQFELSENIVKQVIDKRNLEKEMPVSAAAAEVSLKTSIGTEPDILKEIKQNYDLTLETARKVESVTRGDDNWYKHCGITMRKMASTGVDIKLLENFLVEHIVDMLLYSEKLELLQYLFLQDVTDENSIQFKVKSYLDKKIITSKKLIGIILFDGDQRKILVLKNKRWVDAEPEDERDLSNAIKEKFTLTKEFSHLLGFIGKETKSKYVVFKVKDTKVKRNTGARCDEAGKAKTIKMLNSIVGEEKYNKENTKSSVQTELCCLQEFTLRLFDVTEKNGKRWFLDPELAHIYKV